MREYLDKIRHHYFSSSKEVALMCAVSFLFSILLVYAEASSLPFTESIPVYVISFIVVAFSLFFHDAAHRLVALKLDCVPKYSISKKGFIASLVVGLLTAGKVKMFVGESFSATPHRVHRLGRFFYHQTIGGEAGIALAGPLATIILAGVAKAVSILAGEPVFFELLAGFNVYYALWSILPIPGFDGFKLFYYGRQIYVTIAGTVVAYLFFVAIGYPGVVSFIGSLFIGGLFWWMFVQMVEK